jgi:hypothetical protein
MDLTLKISGEIKFESFPIKIPREIMFTSGRFSLVAFSKPTYNLM